MGFLLLLQAKRKLKKLSKLISELAISGRKGVAWLVDPDKYLDFEALNWINEADLDLILFGGSSVDSGVFQSNLSTLKRRFPRVPLCIFPGSADQLSPDADGVLFLSLISGTNPEFLISSQIKAAFKVVEFGLEALPTGYLLINSGELLSVHKASNTLPILNSEVEKAVQISLAGKLLGLDYLYLEAGSGAKEPVSPEIISQIKKQTGLPLFVGGGIRDSKAVRRAFDAGADLVVLGNSIEKDPSFLAEVLEFKAMYNQLLHVN